MSPILQKRFLYKVVSPAELQVEVKGKVEYREELTVATESKNQQKMSFSKKKTQGFFIIYSRDKIIKHTLQLYEIRVLWFFKIKSLGYIFYTVYICSANS